MEGVERISLDGSYGLGMDAEVTVITRDIESAEGTKKTTYRFPFGVVCFEQLIEALKVGLIQGFSIEKLGVQKPLMVAGFGDSHGKD